MSENDTWVERLQSSERRDEALEELRQILTRGLSRSLARRGGGEAFVDDIVQESLLKIMSSLDSFEGRSQFTTWAMTIATRIGISSLRRRHFQDVSLDEITGGDDVKLDIAVDTTRSPDRQSLRDEILRQVRDVINEDLTEKQRTVVHGALGGMPIEEIAARMSSNRNAIYKVFHDARKRLRRELETRGIDSTDLQAVLD